MLHAWHQGIWQQLQAARHSGHLPHALLFSGESGCDHESLVHELARSLLCLQPAEDFTACGQCRSCQVHAGQAHPDFLLVKAAEDKQVIGVDQIRNLNHFLDLSRSYSACRVAIILYAEDMNINAANSLLKSLEEPADNTHILLYTGNFAALLPTVRSRCQHLRMLLPRREEAIHWLQQKNPVQAPETLLKLAKGRPLLALEKDSGEKLTDQVLFFRNINALMEKSASLSEVSAHWEKYDRSELLDWQLVFLHDFLYEYYGAGNGGGAGVAEVMPALSTEGMTIAPVWTLYERLLELKQLATHPLNPRLFVENMLSLWLIAFHLKN